MWFVFEQIQQYVSFSVYGGFGDDCGNTESCCRSGDEIAEAWQGVIAVVDVIGADMTNRSTCEQVLQVVDRIAE